MEQIGYIKNTSLSKDNQVKQDPHNVTSKVSFKVIDIEEAKENCSEKLHKMNVPTNEIGIAVVDVKEKLVITSKSDFIGIEKHGSPCAKYMCGSCKVYYSTLCNLHDHFEMKHSTGSYIYYQDRKMGVPRLESVSNFTQTDITFLLEVDQSHFKNDEVCDVESNVLETESDIIYETNIEILDGTKQNKINDDDDFENLKVLKSNDRRKKKTVKQKTGEKNVNLKVVTNSETNSIFKNYVNQKRTVKRKVKNSKASKLVPKTSNNFNKCESLSNSTVDLKTNEVENDLDKNKLTTPDDEEMTSKNEAISSVSSQNNFTSINETEDCKTTKPGEKLLSHMKRRQNQIPSRKRARNKMAYEIKDDGTSDTHRCNICATKYVSKVKLQYHMTKVHKIANTDCEKQCRWCGLTFPGSKSYISHMRQCEKNEYLMCLICMMRFDSRTKVSDHLLVHRNEGELKCRVCGKTFTCATTLQSHLRRHNLKRDLQCEYCGKYFCYDNLLKKHKLYCNREPDIECPQCAVKFKTQESLKHHMSVHSNDRPFVCHVCGYAAKKSMYLKRHLRCHTGERPYVCSDCGMSFAAANGLNRHRKTHTNEKPCICQYCGKSFTNNWNLKTHLRQHTGDTPYQCRQCGKAFKQNVLLKLHTKSHHNI